MSDKVKITIRLSAPLVRGAKIQAAAHDEDLQDFVERVLWEAVREPLPPLFPKSLERLQGKKVRRAKVSTFAMGAGPKKRRTRGGGPTR